MSFSSLVVVVEGVSVDVEGAVEGEGSEGVAVESISIVESTGVVEVSVGGGGFPSSCTSSFNRSESSEREDGCVSVSSLLLSRAIVK